MPTGGRSTLTQFLIEERRRAPAATGDLNALITAVSLACKAISRRVAFGALEGAIAAAPRPAEHDLRAEPRGVPLEVLANQLFLDANEWGGHVAGMLSEALQRAYVLPPHCPRGKYLLVFDALEGGASADVNGAVGSIFSVLRAGRPGEDARDDDFLQAGTRQVCAGYAIYGPSTMLVLTLGHGTHAFTLEPMLGEWVLSHPRLHVPERTCECAIDTSNSRFWEPAVKRYVDECLAGQPGPRGVDFNMRWIASVVAETHRILVRGGVLLCPSVAKAPARAGRLRPYEANAMAFLIEQAGGRASNGKRRLMDLEPETLRAPVGLVLGSADEVARIEAYHRDMPDYTFASPLFGHRGLFADAA